MDRQMRTIDQLPPNVQLQLYEEYRVIKEYRKLKELNGGIVPYGALEAAMEKLGIKSPTTIHNKIQRCIRFEKKYPGQPGVNALINMAGRPEKKDITEEQRKVAIGAFVYTKRQSVLSTGKYCKIVSPPEVTWVHSILTRMWPDINLEEKRLKRILKQVIREDPILVDLGRAVDEDAIWVNYLIKRPNRSKYPNFRWQSDGRPLPIRIKIGNIWCTVTLVSIIDENTQFVLDYILVPRKMVDANGTVRDTDFTAEDVRLLFAHAMYITQVRPEQFYTDRGSQYRAIEAFLDFLNDETLQPHIEWIPGRVRYPPGKGKIEKFQHLISDFLCRLPGWYDDTIHKYPPTVDAKLFATLLTFEELEQEFATRVATWNYGGEAPTRADRWKERVPASLPAPLINRLALLGRTWNYTKAYVAQKGIRYNSTHYQAKETSGAAYQRLQDQRGRRVPICMVSLGSGIFKVIARIDGKTFEEVIPYEELPSFDSKTYSDIQDQAKREKRGKLKAMRTLFEQVAVDMLGAMPAVDAHSSEAVLPADNSETSTKKPTNRRASSKAPSLTVMDHDDDLKDLIIPDFMGAIEQNRAS